MNNTFGALTQPFIKRTSSKNNTSVLQLLMFHETGVLNPKKDFKVLSYVIYTIIDSCVCIDSLSCQSKQLSQISVDYKYVEKYFNRILGIGILYLLMKLLSSHGFLKNIKSIFIIKCPKRMLKYYFSNVFGILK